MAVEHPASREVTPENLYWNRRSFLRTAGGAASVLVTGWVYRHLNRTGSMSIATDEFAGYTPASPQGQAQGFTLDEPQTPLQRAVNYNNFYEFTTDKEEVSAAARNFV